MSKVKQVLRRVFLLSKAKGLQNIPGWFRKVTLAVYWLALALIGAVVLDSLLPDYGRNNSNLAKYSQVYMGTDTTNSAHGTFRNLQRLKLQNRLAEDYEGNEQVIDSLLNVIDEKDIVINRQKSEIEDFSKKHGWGYWLFAKEIDKAKAGRDKTKPVEKQQSPSDYYGDLDAVPAGWGSNQSAHVTLAANVLAVELPLWPVAWPNMTVMASETKAINGVTLPKGTHITTEVRPFGGSAADVKLKAFILPGGERVPAPQGSFIAADPEGQNRLPVTSWTASAGTRNTTGQFMQFFQASNGFGPLSSLTTGLSYGERNLPRESNIPYIGPVTAYAIIK